MTAALKHIDEIPATQPTMAASFNTIRRDYIIPVESDTDHVLRSKRKFQFCANPDPVWHKRLKVSSQVLRRQRSMIHRRVHRRERSHVKYKRKENKKRYDVILRVEKMES